MQTGERVRAEQRWVGLASGFGSRALRYLTSFVITTAYVRVFGSATWGIVVIAMAATDLFLYAADFAVPELCAYEAARASDYATLQARIGQALWLITPPALLGMGVLLLAAQLTPLWYQHGQSEQTTLTTLLIACACGSPLVLFANCFAATLQGLGHLREMNSMHGLSALVELGLVLGLLAVGIDVAHLQWARSAGQGIRLLGMLAAFTRLGLSAPLPRRPDRAVLREMARYCFGLSVLKTIANAIGRTVVPLAQLFTTTAIIGSVDLVDRVGSVLQRASNPVADSLFQRLVRAFDASATDAARASGRRDFLAGSLLLIGFSASITLGLLNLSRWLFPLWLGPSLARDPIAFAPWVMTSWSIGMAGIMSGMVLVAMRRIRASIWVHALALVVTVMAIVILGLYARAFAQDGRYALLVGPALGATVCAIGLNVVACRITGVSVRQFGALVWAIWAPAWLAIAAARLWPSPWVVAFSTMFGLLGIGLVAARNASVRSFVHEFRSSRSSIGPSSDPQ